METTLSSCPVCAEGSLIRFEPAFDVDGNTVDVLQCRSCFALINSRAHSRLKTDEVEEVQLTDYYLSDSLSVRDVEIMITEKGQILNYLYSKITDDFSKKTFCDFGGGAGLVSIAASIRFKNSYICEFDIRSVNQICSVIKKPDNMGIVTSLEDINEKIDVLFMWHVLEHIPRPLEFMHSIRKYLADDCIFFLQCPGYRPSSIVDCHYTFFNEPSMRALFASFGAKEIEIGFDLNNGFVGYLGRI